MSSLAAFRVLASVGLKIYDSSSSVKGVNEDFYYDWVALGSCCLKDFSKCLPSSLLVLKVLQV